MNPEHHQLICRGLEELAALPNAETSWITLESNGGEHWLQYRRGELNLDWPFAQAPEPLQLKKFLAALGPFEIVAWDKDLYATITIAEPKLEPLALTIGLIFRDLYGLGNDHKLTYKIEGD
jgi:hypothetical protein